MRHNEKSLSAEGSLQVFVWCFVRVIRVYTIYIGITRHLALTKLNTTSLSAPVEALEEMKPLV